MTVFDMTMKTIDEAVIVPRAREVWLRDDQKVLNRAVKLLMARWLAVDLHCLNADCEDNTIQRQPNAAGFDLLCGCKRRVFNQEFFQHG